MPNVPTVAQRAAMNAQAQNGVAFGIKPASSKPTTYRVKSGDTVSSIASRHGLKTADVLAWNGLGWRTVIYPGQTIRLTAPSSGDSSGTPTSTGTSNTNSNTNTNTSSGAKTHTVVRGDTVYGIAKKYGTTVSAILKANGIGSNALIFPGQKLTIPSGSSNTGGNTGTGGNSGTNTNTSTDSTSSTTDVIHTVVRGDTVYGIAKKYGTTVSAILKANGIGSNAIIYPGQKLTIPGSGASSSGDSGGSTSGDSSSDTTGSTAGTADPDPYPQRYATLNSPQIENTQLIVRIGRELGVSERGIAIALATAMVESSLRNVDYGDRDSLGLFQQRPSTGWGTPEQIMNRDHSIRAFYGGPGNPNAGKTRGLLDIAGWEKLEFTVAAQRVQISAFPNRYGQWEKQAFEWLKLHG